MDVIRSPYCKVGFESPLSMEAVGTRISAALFGGVEFEQPLNWFDENNAIRLSRKVLGLQVFIVQSWSSRDRFWLLMESSRPSGDLNTVDPLADLWTSLEQHLTEEERFPNRIHLNAYIAMLLADVPDIEVLRG